MSLCVGIASGCPMVQAMPIIDLMPVCWRKWQAGLRRGQRRWANSDTWGCIDTSCCRRSPRGCRCCGQHSHNPPLPPRNVLVGSRCVWAHACVYSCTSPLQPHSENWASTPPPLSKWSVSSTSVCRRAPLDALLGCWALAVAMAGANEKNKPVLTRWINISLLWQAPC